MSEENMNQEFENWIINNLTTQKGKVVLITGANTGIGYYTALAFAKMGAHVIVAGRNQDKINNAIESMRAENIIGTLEAGILDLTTFDSVRKFAEKFKNSHAQLDILINNAGVMMPPESKTEEGFELQFGVNFLAHFLLTGLLYETMRFTLNSRIITVASIAHRGALIDFDNLRLERTYDARREYCQSKLANVLFALELGKRIKSNHDKIFSIPCHPGITKTDLQRHLDPKVFEKMKFMDTWQGSLPTLIAATKPKVQSGEYYGPDGEGELSGFPALGVIDNAALNDELSKKLWKEANYMTGLNFLS
jgi:NAD(P)-dependent dehydrogenase (short-subunit alcohol dehydrogenase family)